MARKQRIDYPGAWQHVENRGAAKRRITPWGQTLRTPFSAFGPHYNTLNGLRMARRQRTDFPGAWHHVMNRGAARMPVVLDDRDRTSFISTLARCVTRFGLEVHAYCLLDNHFHLLVKSPEAQLSAGMQFLMREHTQIFNKKHKRDGPLFRGRFHSILVDSDTYLHSLSRYIHRNPIGAGLTSERSLSKYRWSSYPTYVEAAPAPSWLTRNVVRESQRATSYRRYVESSETGPAFDAAYEIASWDTGLVLGGSDFVDRLFENHSIDLRGAVIDLQKVDVAAIDNTVRALAGASQGDLQASRRGIQNVARLVAVEISGTFTNTKRDALAAHYGFVSDHSITSAISRSRSADPRGEVAALRREVLDALGLTAVALDHP